MYLMDSDHQGIYRFDVNRQLKEHLRRHQGLKYGTLEGTLVKDLSPVKSIHAYRVLEQPHPNKDIIALCFKDTDGRNKLMFVHPMENLGAVNKETTKNAAYCNIYQSEPITSNEIVCVNSEQAEILNYKTKDKTGAMML